MIQKLIAAAIQQVQMMVNTRGGLSLPTPATAAGPGSWPPQPQPPTSYGSQTNPLQTFNPYPPPQHQYPASPNFPPGALPPPPHTYAPSPQGMPNTGDGNPPQFIYSQGSAQQYGQIPHFQQQGLGPQLQQHLPHHPNTSSAQSSGSNGSGTQGALTNPSAIGDLGQVSIPQQHQTQETSEQDENEGLKPKDENAESTTRI